MLRSLRCLAFCLALGSFVAYAAEDIAYDAATADSELMPQAQHALFTDITKTGGGAVAVGERGHVFLSTDLKQWTQVKVPTRTLLTTVFAIDAEIWAAGHDGVILHSADGGQTWARQRFDPDGEGPILDLLFLDPKIGFAIGAYGQFLSTENGGDTWEKQLISDRLVASDAKSQTVDNEAVDAGDGEDLQGVASDDMGEDEGDPHLNAIAKVGAVLLIVGEAGKGYRSGDNGKTWSALRLPYEGSMFGLLALDDGSALAFGLRGNVLLSSDQGASWQALNSGTEQSLMGGAAVAGARAVLVGASGALALRPAGEQGLRVFAFPDGGILSGVLPEPDEKGFVVVGENGILHFTPN